MPRLIFFLAFGIAIIAVGINCHAQPAATGASAIAPSDTSPASIGTAAMQADGTLVLTLRAVDMQTGATGDSQLFFQPANPRYPYILKHVSPIHAGDTVQVKPFPAEYSLEIPKPSEDLLALFTAEMSKRKIDLSLYNVRYFQSGANIDIAIFYKHRNPHQLGSDPVHKEMTVVISPADKRVVRVIHAR
jgi:hypothetical protein